MRILNKKLLYLIVFFLSLPNHNLFAESNFGRRLKQELIAALACLCGGTVVFPDDFDDELSDDDTLNNQENSKHKFQQNSSTNQYSERNANRPSQVGNISIYYPSDITTTFNDVAGLQDVKIAMMDIIEYLENPKIYHDMGARVPKGVLLSGDPGNGKTLIARATAGQVGVPFLSISGSSFIEMYVGVGALRIRELFKLARELAEIYGGCIVFIDEIDALISKRSSSGSGGDKEYNQTINAFLAEVDGLDTSSKPVIIMGATNRIDVLDSAATRSGRFDIKIEVSKPDYSARKRLLENSLDKMKAAENIDLSEIAKLTQGFSGADLANMMNAAAMLAVKERASCVTLDHINRALQTIQKSFKNK